MKIEIINTRGTKPLPDNKRTIPNVYSVRYDPLHYRTVVIIHNGGVDMIELTADEILIASEEEV